MRRASNCHNGQLCEMPADSLVALPFIMYRYIVSFFVYYVRCAWYTVSETFPSCTCNYGEKNMDEELHEIIQNSSYEERVEYEEEEDNEKNNVQIEEEIDDETEASAL